MQIKRVLSILMIFSMLLTYMLPMTQASGNAIASTPFTDIEQSWAKDQLLDWVNKDLIQGYADQTIKPNNSISRAEYVALINRVFGYKDLSDKVFYDVAKDKWYYDEVSKAVRAGYISGYEDGTFRPEENISREEVSKIIFHLMKLNKEENVDALALFKDKNEVHNWSIDYVNALLTKGYITGYQDQTFRPTQSITRAEAIVLLDRITGKLIHQAGTYGNDEEQTIITGNMTINTKDVTIKNTLIKGNLYLAPGIGEGEVYLHNVTVEGTTIVSGGGENSVVFYDSFITELLVEKIMGRVRLLTEGNTEIMKAIIKTGVKLQEGNTLMGFNDVQIMTINPEDSIQLIGDFIKVTVMERSTLEILDNSKISDLETANGTDGTKIYAEDGSVIDKITLNSAVTVGGKGTVYYAVINSDGSSFEQEVVKYELSVSVTLVMMNGNEVDESSSEEQSGSTGGGTGTGPGGSGTGADSGSGSDSGSTPGPVEGTFPQVQGVFIIGDRLYVDFSTADDFSMLNWTINNTVTEDVYSSQYLESIDHVGVYTFSEGDMDGAEYTAKLNDSSEIYNSVVLGTTTVSNEVYGTVSEAVYGYVYYGGTETISFNINNQYEVTSLEQQIPTGALPLADGDVMTLYYGSGIILTAIWDNVSGKWNFNQFVTKPDAPVNVIAAPISNTEINVKWNAVLNAEYYYIYYSDALNGEYVPLRDFSGEKMQIQWTSEGHIDGTNLPHTTRYYKVTAVNHSLESDYSNAAAATTYYNYHIALNFEITDTVQHPTEPIIYITDKTNKQLHAVNYETEEITSISFDLAPESIAYANGEIYVALLKGEHSSYWTNQAGAIAIVDATTLTVTDRVDINIDPYDIAVGRDGYFYVSSGSDQWTDMKSYSRTSLLEVASSGIRQQSFIDMHPTQNKVYTITTESSPRDITAYNVLNGLYQEATYPGGYDSPYHGDYDMNTNLTISPDGKYLFNSAGTIFLSTNSEYDDMRYVYSLNFDFADIAFELGNNTFYTAVGKQINVYDYSNFEQNGLYHTDGETQWVFNDNLNGGLNGATQLKVISSLNGGNILEIVEKDSMEAVAPTEYAGVKLDGTIVDQVVNPVDNKMYAVDKAFRKLYTVDLDSQAIVHTLKLDYEPSGLSLSEDNSKLYIVNDDGNKLVTEINLSDYTITRHLNYVSVADERDFSKRHIYVNAGLLYVVLGDWEPKLVVFDEATFAAVSYTPALKGIGDMVFTSDNSKFYYWYQYGWDAGNAGSDVYAYSVNGTTLTKVSDSQLGYPNMDRDPLDTPILLSEVLGKVVAKDKVFNSNDLTQVIHEFSEPIYAINPSGTIVVEKHGIYNLETYELIESINLDSATEIFYDMNGNLFYIINNVLYRK